MQFIREKECNIVDMMLNMDMDQVSKRERVNHCGCDVNMDMNMERVRESTTKWTWS
jgi:hypothetical protein